MKYQYQGITIELKEITDEAHLKSIQKLVVYVNQHSFCNEDDLSSLAVFFSTCWSQCGEKDTAYVDMIFRYKNQT